ncbi:MAG: hypothetical protein ABI432_15485 [Flavobacteriales bacterium]
MGLNYLKKQKRLLLHALEPGETLYERCYWLALFVKDLKGKLGRRETHNAQLLRQVKELCEAKAKADRVLALLHHDRQCMMDDMENLKAGLQHAA